MNDEMVKRLRLWAENMHGQKSSVIAVVITEAADEIERLREQLRLANIDNFNTTAEVERLRAERDEARRMVCALDADIMEDQMEYARHRGWDCYREVKP